MPTFQAYVHCLGVKPSLLTNTNLKALKSSPFMCFEVNGTSEKILTGT